MSIYWGDVVEFLQEMCAQVGFRAAGAGRGWPRPVGRPREGPGAPGPRPPRRGARRLPNPYVGPRPFETGGAAVRARPRARELLDLFIAERIVLLYLPSGAGKTSLLQAALIPAPARTKASRGPCG